MLILLLALLGQDFETRYHDAYVLEVVDGKPADAARAYLELLRAEALPPRLKFQARFRVAVTLALLGRPDEARARLAELAADEETPKTLQPQIAEYRKALEGAGLGSDLEKRMEELIYGLGRSDENTPAEYRDFAIIGKAALPFLLKLRDHPDLALREHAFRLLCRLDVGGLGGAFSPWWNMGLHDLGDYLGRHPAEIPAAEAKLRALPEEECARVVSCLAGVEFSQECLDALAARPGVRDLVVPLRAARPHLGRWIRDGDPALALVAVNTYGLLLKDDKDRRLAFDAALFPHVQRRLVGVPKGGTVITEFVRRVSPEMALAALDELLAIAEKWDGPAEGSPLQNYLIYAVAYALQGEQVDPGRFAGLLDRWSRLGGGDIAAYVLPLYAKVIGALPEARGLDIARAMAGSTVRSNQLLDSLLIASLPRTLAALEATAGQRREEIAHDWLGRISNPPKLEYRRAVLGSIARILPLLSEGQTAGLSQFVPALADGVEPEVARRAVLAVLNGLRAPNLGARDMYATRLIAGQGSAEQLHRWRNKVIVPLLAQFAALGDERLRNTVVSQVLALVTVLPPLDDEGKKGVAQFLRAQPNWCQNPTVLAALQEFYAPEEWIPRVSSSNWSGVGVRDPDRVTAALAASPASPTPSVVAFIRANASKEIAREALATLFRNAKPAALGVFAGEVEAGMVLERLQMLCRDGTAPVETVAVLAEDLARRAPSEELLEIVRWLFRSNSDLGVGTAIGLAKRLGREELLPWLKGLLDSMDANRREAAKEAIDAILELRRLKEEIAQRIAERGVK